MKEQLNKIQLLKPGVIDYAASLEYTYLKHVRFIWASLCAYPIWKYDLAGSASGGAFMSFFVGFVVYIVVRAILSHRTFNFLDKHLDEFEDTIELKGSTGINTNTDGHDI